MRALLYALSLFVASGSILRGEGQSGYRYPIEVRMEEEVVSDSPAISSVLLRIPSAPFGKEEIGILFETQSRKVIRAVWQTKGGAFLQLPPAGVSLPPKPSKLRHPVVILPTGDLAKADSSKISLLGVLWTTDDRR